MVYMDWLEWRLDSLFDSRVKDFSVGEVACWPEDKVAKKSFICGDCKRCTASRDAWLNLFIKTFPVNFKKIIVCPFRSKKWLFIRV